LSDNSIEILRAFGSWVKHQLQWQRQHKQKHLLVAMFYTSFKINLGLGAKFSL